MCLDQLRNIGPEKKTHKTSDTTHEYELEVSQDNSDTDSHCNLILRGGYQHPNRQPPSTSQGFRDQARAAQYGGGDFGRGRTKKSSFKCTIL